MKLLASKFNEKKFFLRSQLYARIWTLRPCQRKPNARLEIYKAFQDRLTFLIDDMIVWIGEGSSISQIY